jgi:acyl dehydratase
MWPPLLRVLVGRKPYYAASGAVETPIALEIPRLVLRESHRKRYREVCAIPESPILPPAFLHVVAMPLHLQLFIAASFPVKVLGLIHVRNTIRLYRRIGLASTLRLRVNFDTMRETDMGQEYDFVTRAESAGELVWEEVSTMFARNPRATPRRQAFERSMHPPQGNVHDRTIDIAKNTGWRYACVSDDYNPIHLAAITARWFGFRQAVSHGMWSMARCLGEAARRLPQGRIQIDCQFKLPVYLPSQAIVRDWPTGEGLDISMATIRGERVHLAMQVRRIGGSDSG